MAELKPRPNGYPIKLVRDHTAEIINASGKPGDLWYAPLTDATERSDWLRKKLVEEVAEFVVDGGSDELADVYAVVSALADTLGMGDLDRWLKDDPRGGFFDGVMMYGRHGEFDRVAVRDPAPPPAPTKAPFSMTAPVRIKAVEGAWTANCGWCGWFICARDEDFVAELVGDHRCPAPPQETP